MCRLRSRQRSPQQPRLPPRALARPHCPAPRWLPRLHAQTADRSPSLRFLSLCWSRRRAARLTPHQSPRPQSTPQRRKPQHPRGAPSLQLVPLSKERSGAGRAAGKRARRAVPARARSRAACAPGARPAAAARRLCSACAAACSAGPAPRPPSGPPSPAPAPPGTASAACQPQAPRCQHGTTCQVHGTAPLKRLRVTRICHSSASAAWLASPAQRLLPMVSTSSLPAPGNGYRL